MDVFDLSAKLSLDSKDYDRSLQNAATEADRWATKFVMATKAVTNGIGIVAKGISGLASEAVKNFSSFQQLEGGIKTMFGTQGKSFEDWSKTFSESSDSMDDYIDAARKVINGDFGSGQERKDLLTAAGYDPATVQQMVNNLINGVDVASNISADTISANMQTAEEKYESLQRAQDKAMQNAAGAYATAGLSANEYMDTVMSFAAGLNQALGGDTEAAVDKADMAIQDMADNANKMGTPMANIQAAYQGFAKQNYTMLDNLKLGYGGTKTEMERLLKDAQKITGVKYDINNLSDVYDAIHEIQKETGITGATADEAATTIEGSSKAMKASWRNVLTSLVTGGEFFNESLEGLKTSTMNFVRNIVPAFQNALHGIADLISALAPIISSELPGLVKDLVPGFVDAIIQIVASIMDVMPTLLGTLKDITPMIIDSLIDFIPTLIDFFVESIPQFVSLGITLLTSLVSGLADNIETIVPQLTQAMIDIVDQLISIVETDGADLASAGLAMLSALVDALINAVPSVLAQTTQLIQDLTASLTSAAEGDEESFLTTATTILTNLVNGLVESLPDLLPQLTSAATEFITQFASLAASNTTELTNTALTLLSTLITGLSDSVPKMAEDLTTAVMAIIEAIINVITNLDIVTFADACAKIVTTLADGIVAAVGVIAEKLPALITGIVAWLTNPENLTGILEAAVTIFGELVADIPAIVESLATGLAGIVTGIYTYFKDHGDEILQGFKDGFVNIGTKFGEIWEEKIKPAFEDLGEKFKTWFTSFEWGQAISDFLGGVKEDLSGLWDKVKESFSGEEGFGAKIKNFFSQFDWGGAILTFVNKLKTTISEKWELLKNAFTGEDGFLGKIKSWIGSFDLGKIISDFIQKIKDAIEGAWDTFKEWIQGKISGLFSGIKVPDWVQKLFGKGGGEGEGENAAEGGDEPESLVDMPENMVTLDYSNLEPIPSETLESYQLLADAITSMNDAITGGEEGNGLNANLTNLPTLFSTVLTAAKDLGTYLSGGFVSAINTMLEVVSVTSTDKEGNVNAGGGNTLVTAMGVVYDVFADILATSQLLAGFWKTEFIAASVAMRNEAGPAGKAVMKLGAFASGAAAQFSEMAASILDVVDALNILAQTKGAGSGTGSKTGKKGNNRVFEETRASGGPVRTGSTYLVGEQGPELFTAPRTGYIHPNESLGRSETVINVNVGEVYGESYLNGYVTKTLTDVIRKELQLAS